MSRMFLVVFLFVCFYKLKYLLIDKKQAHPDQFSLLQEPEPGLGKWTARLKQKHCTVTGLWGFQAL